MQEIRVMLDGVFLALDVSQQGLDFLNPHGIGFTPAHGLFEITFESVFLDSQRIETPLEFVPGRLPDLGDLLLESFKFDFRFEDFPGQK